MTKKDYDLIAACLGASYQRHSGNEIATKAIQDVELRIRVKLSLGNPQFDCNKFMLRIQYWSDTVSMAEQRRIDSFKK